MEPGDVDGKLAESSAPGLKTDGNAAPATEEETITFPTGEQKKTGAKQGLASFALIPFILLYAILIVWGANRLVQRHEYYAEDVIATLGSGPVKIYCSPNDNAARAAANYLAYALEQTLGFQSELVTEHDETFRGIVILCGEEPPGEPEHQAVILFTSADALENTAAGDDEETIYSLHMDESGVRILVPNRENCFGAVKAITDRWLQTDCGLTGDGELVISHAIIDNYLTGLQAEVTGQIHILTQNLRNADDGEGKTIAERSKRFFKLVEEYQPDLIGTQEATWKWMQLLDDQLTDRYELYGCSRLGAGTQDGEWNTILYRKDRFTFIEGDTFWLSNTPSKPATKLNYEGAVRICTWVLLQDSKTGKILLFSNTHLQNSLEGSDSYPDVRARQADILLQKLRGNGNMLAQYPGFLTGDFNGMSSEPYYSAVTEVYCDAQTTAITDSSKVNYSFHDYGRTEWLIDFCFYSPKNITVLDYQILDKQYGGYVSDHFGILVTAVLY